MRRTIVVLGAVAGALVLPVAAGATDRSAPAGVLGSGPAAASSPYATPFAGPRVTRATLANGLRVAIVENHSAPAVRITVRYRYGTDDEPRGQNGLAHALEHMMFRGTRALSGSGLVDLQAQLGIDASAETDREETLYYQTVLTGRLEPALRIEADRMRGLALRDASWQSERPALLEEIREAASRRRGVLEDAVRERVYGPTSYAHGGVGTAAAMHAIAPADLRRAYEAAYAPDNALLVIAGDVEPRAALALVRDVFGNVRGHARLARTAQPPPRRGLAVRISGGERTLVDVALESHGSAGPGAAAEAIAAELLAPEHPALDVPLVAHGPCSSYFLDDDTERGGGLYHVLCAVSDDRRPERAASVVRTTLRALAAHPPHDAIARARRSYIDATAFQCDDLAEEADLFGATLSLQHADPRSLDRVAAQVTDAQVAAVLRRWATPLAVGVAQAAPGRTAAEGDKRTRAEPAPRARADEPVVQPAWARAAAGGPLRLAPVPPVSAFALPNGVRVFVDPHPGNGTVYLRAGIDDPAAFGPRLGRYIVDFTLASGTAAWPRSRVALAGEEREMTVDLGSETSAHGFTRDLPVMLDIVADAWRAPRTFRSARLRGLLDATIRPERFWIAVSGDADPAAVRALVTRGFGGWRAGPPAPAPAATAVPTFPPGIHTLPGARPTVRVFMMQPAPREDDPDSAAVALLNEVLGADDDFDTRLMRDLRTRRGLVYGATSMYGAFTQGQLVIAFECAPGDLAAARAAVTGVLDDLRAHPPDAAQLERARRKLVIAAVLARTTASGRLDALAAARAHGVPDDPEQLLRRLAAVTPADAARVARTYLRRERFAEFDDRSTR